MDLIVRPFDASDIPACVELLRGHLSYPTDVLALLPRAWRRLLRDDALDAVVVEGRDRKGTTPIAAFGASVLVTDAWMAAARTGKVPYLSARTIRRELERGSPILRPAAAARGNDAGLNVLLLHYAEARELIPAHARPVIRYQMFDACVQSHRGYRIKDILQEFWDEIDVEYIINGWGRVLTDYRSFFERRGHAFPPLGRRPYLIGLTRDEALRNPGALAAPLFLYTPPEIGFTRAEQRLLQRALQGRTDLELARALGVALPTIKSRWRAIYNRAAGLVPDMGPDPQPSNADGTSRGREKRRRLLEYVRRHSEELRPGLRPAR